MSEPTFREIMQWSEDECRSYIAATRWPDGVECPRCGAGNPYRINRKPSEKNKNRVRQLWTCRKCRRQFTETVGTVFEDSKVSMQTWLAAIHLMSAGKNGVSAHELHRLLGVHIRTAWFMMHRLRYAVAQPPLSEKLSGIIEADEVYVGGKPRTRQPRRGPRPADDPTARVPVVSFLERNGRVKSQPVERVTAATLREAIRDSVDTSSVLMTDESAVYPSVGKLFDGGHFTVNHSQREYARDGWITSNSVESYFARLRRSLTGTHHHVSRHHLHRYVAEQDHRWNTRRMTDEDRRAFVIRAAEGKRLLLKPLARS